MCGAVSEPYEVISSDDMLARIECFNEDIAKERLEKGEEWDWRKERMLLGSDVVALFPSLSASRTAACVRRQAEKSMIKWENIDSDWLRLYIHLNRHYTDNIEAIEHLLPKKK